MKSRFLGLGYMALSLSAVLAFAVQAAGADDGGADVDVRELIKRIEAAIVTVEAPDVGVGSGFVVRRDGVIATCYHVIAGAKEVRVKLPDGDLVDVTGFLAVSPGKDLVLLKIDTTAKLAFLEAAIELPAKGEKVLAFGAPGGLSASVGDGIVSATRTGLDEAIRAACPDYDVDAKWIETTAALSRGNSGGPLVTLDGVAIGVNSWFRRGAEELNFAISTVHLRRLLDDADGVLHQLDSLPTPRIADAAPKGGNGAATMRYWSEIRKLRNASATRRRPPNFSKVAKIVRNSSAQYAKSIAALDIQGVDADLVDVATQDARSLERLATVFASRDAEAYSKEFEAYQQVVEKYDQLRTHFTAKYGMNFPTIFDENEPPKRAAEKPRGTKAVSAGDRDDIEAAAAKELAIAKKLLKNKSEKPAIRRLRKLIEQFPNTTAAGEAREMLKKVGVNDAPSR